MTKALFDMAEKSGKLSKVGVLNPTLRQALGFGEARILHARVSLTTGSIEVAQAALFLASGECDSSFEAVVN